MITRILYNVTLAISFMALLQGCLDSSNNDSSIDEVTLATPNRFLEFFNQYEDPGLQSATYAQAYYAAIDPANQRDTLNKFISHHQNDGSDWTHVIFRDTKDLGYGRDMYMRAHNNANGCAEIAFYVRNFAVEPVPGFDYGPLNLEAAISNDTEFHFSTNAIEVGHADNDVNCTSPRFLKFFTYAPTGEQLLFADFDDRGDKAMPQVCVSCHGGTLRPLDDNRNFTITYPDDDNTVIGDTKSRLMDLSVGTFEFSETPGFTRAAMEPGLKIMNDVILSTYVPTENPAGSTAGEWQGAFAHEILEGHYTDSASGQPSPSYIDDFVPNGWRSSMAEGRPADTDRLYRDVIGPHCIVCHAGQGRDNPGDSRDRGGMNIDFETWEKFASFAQDIARLVFDEGRMPLSLWAFDAFWDEPEKPKLLASLIAPLVSDFDMMQYVNDDGSIKRPGRPVANAGLDRHIPPNTPITLNGGSSLFANQFRWEIVTQPNNANPTLDQATSLTPVFTTDMMGLYELSLTVSSDGSMSHTDMVTLEVDDQALDPALLRFSDVKRILQQEGRSGCVGCHAEQSTVFPGIPVWFTDTQSAPPSLSLYQQVRARVNFKDIPRSSLLTRPAGSQHPAQRLGFNVSSPVGSSEREYYDLFVNWIYAGARE